jgi:hypothetical protein
MQEELRSLRGEQDELRNNARGLKSFNTVPRG